ncbi:hypothetical protein CesoFtcFv8_001513 [Champsocephalus esox]|uniref:Uncharacterized protein n=1 Tax=Champsocephalus esox TaxID=159716 RepID=A0AAN8HHZ7_9TELE|nr:hypothetical protein CesoFtcFv8_001513 [Champsocephalus esox]
MYTCICIISAALEQEREKGGRRGVWGGEQDRRDWEIGGGGARGRGGNVSFHWLPIHQGSVYRCAGRQQHRKNKAQHQSPLQGHHSSRGGSELRLTSQTSTPRSY